MPLDIFVLNNVPEDLLNTRPDHQQPFGRRRLLFATTTAAVLGLLMASVQEAAGAEGDLFTPNIFSSIRYDSNYFRLSDEPTNNRIDGAFSPANQGSALTRLAGAGLRIQKAYSLQDVLIDATVTRYTYSNFSSLDATGHDVNARYNFKITPEIGGAVIYKSTAVPTDQADTGFQTVSNIRTTTLKRLDTDWLSGAALHPRISVFEETNNSDLPIFQLENSKTRSVAASLIYLFPSNNTVEAYYRKANGSYQDLLPDATSQLATTFREYQTGARVLWLFNGLSTLSADAGYLNREHAGLAARNFSGFVANVALAYQITGRTRIQLYAARQLYSSQSDISSFAIEESATLSANYAATNTITMIPSVQYVRRNFEDPVTTIPVQLRQISRQGNVEVRWAPLRQLDLSVIVGHESRAATLSGYQYTNRSGQIVAKLHF